jgi:hypothetical protein
MTTGGALSHVQDGQERVVAYYSKTLSRAERKYCLTRWELLAIVKTLEHFHECFYGQESHLRTDHSTLIWLLGSKNLEGQTARWFSVSRSSGLHSNIAMDGSIPTQMH